MKIDYPVIDVGDIREGDTVLSQWMGEQNIQYLEWTVDDPTVLGTEPIYYLIDRPKVPFPEAYGSVIIAKRVRGTSFPDGVALIRQRGSSFSSYSHARPNWKSVGIRIEGADNHPETQVHDWVLAKIVPAE